MFLASSQLMQKHSWAPWLRRGSDLGKAPGLQVCCNSSFLSSLLQENQLKNKTVQEKPEEMGTVCALSSL